jgi:hypothetical protein
VGRYRALSQHFAPREFIEDVLIVRHAITLPCLGLLVR